MILILTAALAAPTFYIEYEGTRRLYVEDTPGAITDYHSDPKKSPQSAFVTVVSNPDPYLHERVLTLLRHSKDTIDLLMYLQDDGYTVSRLGLFGYRRWRAPRKRRKVERPVIPTDP